MGAVLVAALGLTALRYASVRTAGVIFLLTCGVLALSVVGVVCRVQAERAGWFGFALFGWGYLTLAFWSSQSLPELPTMTLTEELRSAIGAPSPGYIGGGVRTSWYLDPSYSQIGHCLWSLLAASVGGMVARVLLASRVGRSAEDSDPVPHPTRQASRRWWRRPVVIGCVGLFLVTPVAVLGLRSASWVWVGATLLLTCGLLGLAALGAACGRGRCRAVWLGATLFGGGYMILIFCPDPNQQTAVHFATNQFLNALRQGLAPIVIVFPPSSGSIEAANARIMKALDQPVPMNFPDETPLQDVLTYIKGATHSPNKPEIPIYVDPIGLQEAEHTMQSTVRIENEGVSLKVSLHHVLEQLGLSYCVRDGLLLISSQGHAFPFSAEPFLVVEHCLMALLAAGLGSLAALLVYDPRNERANSDQSNP